MSATNVPSNIFYLGLQGICLSIVVYEIYNGTVKYISEPIASKVYTMGTELPTMSICPKNTYMDPVYGLNHHDFSTKGKFVPDNFANLNKTLDEIFNEFYDGAFYLLDVKAPKANCKVEKFENGWAKRFYIGSRSKSESGRNCLNWKDVKAAKKYYGKQGVGDHKFCRKPSNANMKREFCFISQNETEFCRVRTCDFVKVEADVADIDTEKGKKVLPVHSTGFSMFGFKKCASYDLSRFQKLLRKLTIFSPFDVDILFHNNGNLTIHRELSLQFIFEGNHRIEVATEKFKNLNSKHHSCYTLSNYSEMELSMLGKKIKEKFNCTSPFIPSELRYGAEICRNKTVGSLVTSLFRSLSGVFATNNWNDNYFFMPPCTYNSYSLSSVDYPNKLNHSLYLTKADVRRGKPRYFSTKELQIFFKSKMTVTEQFWSYTFLAYIAECGGFVGLFLGYSILQIGDLFQFVSNKFYGN